MWPFRKKKQQQPVSQSQDRELFKSNLNQIVSIEHELYPQAPWLHEDFQTVLNNNGVLHVHFDGPLVVGYLCRSPDARGHRIHALGVRKEYQRMKVATYMVGVLKSCMDLGETALAYVSDQNVGAHLFFRSVGFKAVRVRRGYYQDGTDAYVFAFRKGVHE